MIINLQRFLARAFGAVSRKRLRLTRIGAGSTFTFVLPVNPPVDRLGKLNAVLSGRSTRYHVPDFEGCLSVKSVVSGTAVWESENRRFQLNEDRWLILNDRQRYALTIDSSLPVTTFCLFFARGFVEEIYRTHVTSCHRLLDSPEPDPTANVTFLTRIEPAGKVKDRLELFRAELAGTTLCITSWEDAFQEIGELVVGDHSDASKAMVRLPAIGHSTRQEVYRRLLRGRDFLLSSLSEPIRLRDIASAACLSPSHFHRSFRHAFGETPHRFLTRHRLEEAAKMLRRANSSVTDVCLSTGFESVASFSILFRRHYGVPPSKFSKIQ